MSTHDSFDHHASRSLATGSGIGLLIESGRPNGNYYAGTATKFGTAWNVLVFSFNVITTSLICGRILYIGRRVSVTSEGTQAYTGAIAIIVESALPFTLGSMAYVIAYGIGSDLAIAFSCYAMFTVRAVFLRDAWNQADRRTFRPSRRSSLRCGYSSGAHGGRSPHRRSSQPSTSRTAQRRPPRAVAA